MKWGAIGAIAVAAAVVAVFSLRGTDNAGAAAKRDPVARPMTTALAKLTAGPRGEIAAVDPTGDARIEGEVIDGNDKPVGGASVTIDTLPIQTVTTEEDGTFVFEQLLDRRYRIVAAAPDGVAGPLFVRAQGKGEPVILRTRAAAAFDVSVIDALSGAGIEGAKVEVRAPILVAAVTDAKGSVALTAITPGHWTLVVTAEGYATGREPMAASATTRGARTIALARGMSARGSVADTGGKPVADANVWLENVSDAIGSPDPIRDGARTAADGTFTFTGVARGSYLVHAIAPDRSTATSKVVRIDRDTNGIALRTEPGARVAGTVVRADRAPAAAATVYASWKRGNRLVHVDREGRFVFEGLPAGEIWLTANDGAAASKPRRLELARDTDAGTIEVVLDNTGTIAGTVVDKADVPVEGAVVTGMPTAASGNISRELSDSSGNFVLHGLAAGDYELTATRDPIQPPSRTATMVAAGATGVRLVVTSAGRIKGKVALNGGGRPAVYSVRVGRTGLPTSFTTGGFEVDAAPGTQSLWIEGRGFTASSVPGIEVADGATVDAGEIELERGRVIRGRVTSFDGLPLANGEVMAGALLLGNGERVDTGEAGPEFRDDVKRVTVDADGGFELAGVSATPISLVASLASGARSAPVQIPAGNTDVTGVTLVVKKEAALSGTVTRDGKPARAIVNAQAQDSPLTMFTVMANDGEFSYDRLAPGRYTVAAIAGPPLLGSPFYPRVVDLAAGKAATLDIAIVGGNASLTVQAPGSANGLVFVTTKPGTATSGLGLIGELGKQDGGAWALTALRDGGARFFGLPAGPARACVVPIAVKGADMNALIGQIVRAGTSLGALCQTTELGATSTVSIGVGK